MLLVLDQRERLCSISEEADFGFSFSFDCWFRTECANCKKVVEPMGLSFGWDAASCFNSKCVCPYGMPFRFLIVNVQVETTNDFKFLAVLRCLGWNQWVWRLVLSFSYGVTFLINFYTWQIFKLGVFLHVAMALIAGKGLNPPIIGILNQNSQKRTNTQGSFIPINTSTFYITLIFSSFFWLLSMVLKNFHKLQHGRTNELKVVGRGNQKFKNSWFLRTMPWTTYQGKLITKWIAWLTLGIRPKSNSNLGPKGHKFNCAGHTL